MLRCNGSPGTGWGVKLLVDEAEEEEREGIGEDCNADITPRTNSAEETQINMVRPRGITLATSPTTKLTPLPSSRDDFVGGNRIFSMASAVAPPPEVTLERILAISDFRRDCARVMEVS